MINFLCYFWKFLKSNLFKSCDSDKYKCLFCLVIRQQKYLKSLHGGDEDGMQDEEDDEGIKKTIVGRKHRHGADNRNFEVRIWA